jgi:N-acetylglucosamine kinase-like BadF-type ATPase
MSRARDPGAGPVPVELVIGMDVGGSKTHAALSDGSRVLLDAHGGSANLPSVGEQLAGQQLTEVLGRLVAGARAAGGRVITVCAGAAGVETAREQEVMTALISERVPGAEIRVVHDSQIVLAAAEFEHGIVLISGTGSVAWGAAPGGRYARAGGWGYLLGDEGSGYTLALAAVRHVLGRIDRGEAPDELTDALIRECGLADRHELLSYVYARPERAYWAARTGPVFRLAGDGDRVSRELVASTASALAALVRTVASRLDRGGPVVCAGGQLVNQPGLVAMLRAELVTDGITDVRVLDRAPVHGAIRLALRGDGGSVGPGPADQPGVCNRGEPR